MTWRERVNAEVTLRSESAGAYIRLNCPACLERAGKVDRTRALSVNMNNGWWLCHRCEWRGRLDGYDDEDGWRDTRVLDDLEAPPVEQPSDYMAIGRALAALTTAPHRYLRDRGVPAQTVQAARLGYARKGDHAGRVIMPLVDADDWRNVGWVGRDITGKARRYHVSKGVDGATTFYNDDEVGRLDTMEPLVVTEGPFDALLHWPRAVACLGKLRPGQAQRLAKLRGRSVILVLDGDAWRESLAWARVLRTGGASAWCLRLPPKTDLAELPRKALDEAVAYCLHHQTDTELG